MTGDNITDDAKLNGTSIKQQRDEKIFSIAVAMALLFLIFSWIWVFKFGVPLVHSLHQK